MVNAKEIVCNNDVINDVTKRSEYVKNHCMNYNYIKEKYPNSNYHVLKNSNVKISSKEFLQKMFYDVFLEPLQSCKFWEIEYNFNYLKNNFTTILQVIIFYNENIKYSQIDFEGDLQTLKEIELDKIQKNFITFQNQCIFCLRNDVMDNFVNKEEINKVIDFNREIEKYLENNYPDKEKYYEKLTLFHNHFSENYTNLNGEDFNIVQTFGGDNFNGFIITDTEQ